MRHCGGWSKRRWGLITVSLATAAVAIAWLADINIPFVGHERTPWEIGIVRSSSPLKFDPASAVRVLRAADVSDVRAEFLADPFMIKDGTTWYMFFEVMKSMRDGQKSVGKIGLAVSRDLAQWTYVKIVLDEQFHMSYPYVFKWHGEFYMIPESYQAKSIRLYRATKFPEKWVFDRVLVTGDYVDSSYFEYQGTSYLFASSGAGHQTLRLFVAQDLLSEWREHPLSPIMNESVRFGRSGGRVLVDGDRVVRYAQDGQESYGKRVWAFEISDLSPTTYRESAIKGPPVIQGTGGWFPKWNRDNMHTVDAHQIGPSSWVACVDGAGGKLVFDRKH